MLLVVVVVDAEVFPVVPLHLGSAVATLRRRRPRSVSFDSRMASSFLARSSSSAGSGWQRCSVSSSAPWWHRPPVLPLLHDAFFFWLVVACGEKSLIDCLGCKEEAEGIIWRLGRVWCGTVGQQLLASVRRASHGATAWRGAARRGGSWDLDHEGKLREGSRLVLEKGLMRQRGRGVLTWSLGTNARGTAEQSHAFHVTAA